MMTTLRLLLALVATAGAEQNRTVTGSLTGGWEPGESKGRQRTHITNNANDTKTGDETPLARSLTETTDEAGDHTDNFHTDTPDDPATEQLSHHEPVDLLSSEYRLKDLQNFLREILGSLDAGRAQTQRAADDCWYHCGETPGACSWCPGPNGVCCKDGVVEPGCPGSVGGNGYHACAVDSASEPVNDPANAVPAPPPNAGKDCWWDCNRQSGPCGWCDAGASGSEGMCCRSGYIENGCDGVLGGSNNHTCVYPAPSGPSHAEQLAEKDRIIAQLETELNALADYRFVKNGRCGHYGTAYGSARPILFTKYYTGDWAAEHTADCASECHRFKDWCLAFETNRYDPENERAGECVLVTDHATVVNAGLVLNSDAYGSQFQQSGFEQTIGDETWFARCHFGRCQNTNWSQEDTPFQPSFCYLRSWTGCPRKATYSN